MTENKQFKIEFDGYKYFHVVDIVNERGLAILDTMADARAWLEVYEMLSDENEGLKERNKNQYKRLTKVWELVEAKDWETLTAMNDKMVDDDKKLQEEWRSYYD